MTRALAAAAAASLVLGGCGGGGDGGGGGGGGGGTLFVEIAEVGGSGESGSAELTPQGERTDVLVQTTGVSGGVPNPVGIWKGTCGNVSGDPAHKLPDLQEGISAATVDISLDELLTGYVVNVQKSATDDTSIACGAIKETR